jgi:ribosome-interacting GTPase 1
MLPTIASLSDIAYKKIRLIRVLMHEVTHAVIEESPLASRKRFDVEEVCDIVGFHIIDVLKDNPQLVEWLFGEKDSPENRVDNLPL